MTIDVEENKLIKVNHLVDEYFLVDNKENNFAKKINKEINKSYKYIFQETKSYNIQKTRSIVELNINTIYSLKTFKLFKKIFKNF